MLIVLILENTGEALLTVTLVGGQLYSRLLSQDPVFLNSQHINFNFRLWLCKEPKANLLGGSGVIRHDPCLVTYPPSAGADPGFFLRGGAPLRN